MQLLRLLAAVSVRAALLAVFVAAILSVLRVKSSAARHAAWSAVLVSMLLMPALVTVAPEVRLPVPLSRTFGDTVGSGREWIAAVVTGPVMVSRGSISSRAPTVANAETSSAATGNNSGAWISSLDPLDRPAPAPVWPEAAVFAYAFVAVLLSLRLWIACRRAAALARTACRIDLRNHARIPHDAADRAVESAAVVVPVTIGVIAPRMLLPRAWREWSEDRLSAVVAHEFAHITRRDPLVSFLAQINRCVFWFHPLAWWLPRMLNRYSEQACDIAGVHAMGGAREYAQVLIEVTRAVRDHGGRVAWDGVGIANGGLLRQRIDHIIDSDTSTCISRTRAALTASACAGAIFLAIACGVPAAGFTDADIAMEQRDHKLRQDLRALWNLAGRDVGRIDWESRTLPIEGLEATLERDPDNQEALRDLLLAYWVRPDPDRRRAHILRLIERHPDTALAGSVEARIFADDRRRSVVFADAPVSFSGDRDGYEQAKALWLAHTSRPDVLPVVLGNAASFFESSDKPLAEQLLVRARALDPQGPWTARLGQFYGTVLVGAEAPAGKHALRTITVGEPRSGYGLAVRRMIAESKDDALLTAVGWFLASSARDRWTGFDPVAWGEACFKRAQQVNPRGVLAHTELLKLRGNQRNPGEPLWIAPPALRHEAVAAMPDAERFERLPQLARTAITSLGDLARWDDPNLDGRRELARRQARLYAEDALRLARVFRSHPKVGLAVYAANMTLGTLAFQDGDRKAAVEFLRRASNAPPSEELAYADGLVSDLHWHLAADLLRAGERQAVALFLERLTGLNLAHRTALRQAAAAIRRGETPRL
jgi:beta-lactamase regulating signal transducer with metallopeptidase domain